MPKKVPFNGTVFVRCDEADTEVLRKIEQSHHLAPTKFTTGLIRAACQFYREHGWFSFPVTIQPEAFQAQYVAEKGQAPYNAPKKAAEKKKPSA